MISSPPVVKPYLVTVILTVLDWPNDPLTFLVKDHPDNVTARHVLEALSGQDTCGDVQYPVNGTGLYPYMEMRYFDDHAFVVRYYSSERVYTPIVGVLNISEQASL